VLHSSFPLNYGRVLPLCFAYERYRKIFEKMSPA